MHYFDFPVIDLEKDSKRVTFVIADSPRLREIVKQYWANSLSVEPVRYNSVLRSLKTRIFNS
ncbi:unnamed protein product [marine sediment metagenome]|uniref:DUF5659 domain-containing protein n=1 Tax=marine sediment metagenome TaxID=412755 RepID=X0SCD7_9ZZZZ